jgi:DNA-directed RNA polymerase subunit RPC12/RpoP
MEISFHCPKCEQGFEVHESAAGEQIQCPNCREILIIPQVSTSSGFQAAKSAGTGGAVLPNTGKRLSLATTSTEDPEFWCGCEKCGELIGFPFEKAEKTVQCPHCLQWTKLMPPLGKQSVPPNRNFRARMDRWRLFVIANWLCSFAIMISGLIYLIHVTGVGGKTASGRIQLGRVVVISFVLATFVSISLMDLFAPKDRDGGRSLSRGLSGVLAFVLFIGIVVVHLNSQIYGGGWSERGLPYALLVYTALAQACYAAIGPPKRRSRRVG